MKKQAISSLILSAAMALTLTACGNNTSLFDDVAGQPQEPVVEEPENDVDEAPEITEADDVTPLPVIIEDVNGSLYRDEYNQSLAMMTSYPVIYLDEVVVNENTGLVERQKVEGYDALEDSISDWNRKQQKAVDEVIDEYGEAAKTDEYLTSMADEYGYMPYYSYDAGAEVVRSDSNILSVREVVSSFFGGAHPNTEFVGYNFDSETGKELLISDVVMDRDYFISAAAEAIRNGYPDIDEEIMGDSLEEMIAEYADVTDSDNPGKLQFTVSQVGIELMFSAYDLCYYAYGPVFATITFESHPDLFNEKYSAIADNFILELPIGGKAMLPKRDGGEMEFSWDFIEATDENGYYNSEDNMLLLSIDGQMLEFPRPDTYTPDMYFVRHDGKDYLYIDERYDNDWRALAVFSLDGMDVTDITGENKSSASFHGMMPVSGDRFLLQSRTDVLSTVGMGRYYTVGADGIPVPETDYWYYLPYFVLNYDADDEGRDGFTITTKIPLELPKASSISDFEGGEKISIPVGTELVLLTTDDIHSAVARTPDGQLVTIIVEDDGDDFYHFLNGEYLEDVFDGVMWAG